MAIDKEKLNKEIQRAMTDDGVSKAALNRAIENSTIDVEKDPPAFPTCMEISNFPEVQRVEVTNFPPEKEIPAPIVNVAAPIVNVPEAVVNIAPPIVNVEAPIVNIPQEERDFPDYNEIRAEYPDSKTEIFIYLLKNKEVGRYIVTYTDASKNTLKTVQKYVQVQS